MLDLTKTKQYYELKWFDGDIIQIPLPKQELLIRMVKLEDEEDIEVQFNVLNKILHQVLQSNINHKKFTEEDYKELDLNTMNLILSDYMGSINKELGE